jgi:hypothetical protein
MNQTTHSYLFLKKQKQTNKTRKNSHLLSPMEHGAEMYGMIDSLEIGTNRHATQK